MVDKLLTKHAKVKLTQKTKFAEKDQRKSDVATKFIGRGSINSSTHQYALDWVPFANCGHYIEDDIVFVSAEGRRTSRLDPDWNEIDLAIAAGAAFVTDDFNNRSRLYNIGERQVADYLSKNGYCEVSNGFWELCDVKKHQKS